MPDQIQDQNQSWAQVNKQPVMGGNPYDLIDNKKQESNQSVVSTPAQSAPVEQVVPVVQQPVQAVAPVNNQVDINANIPAVTQQAVQSVQTPVVAAVQQIKPAVEPGGFTKKLIGFIAKLSGQPDPETGKWLWTLSVNTTQSWQAQTAPSVQGQQVTQVQQGVNLAKNPFDSIMWWVTGFLDKVESKVESVAWIDLDSPINKPMANVAQVVSPVQWQDPVVQQPVQIQVPVSAAPAEQAYSNESDSVVEEIKNESIQDNSIQDNVVAPMVNNESTKEVNKPDVAVPAENDVKLEIKAPIEAVKTEIESVKQNEDVSVNPISENIQFWKSKPV